MAVTFDDVAVCRVCGGPARARYAVCFCCEVLVRQLGVPLSPVVAVANYGSGDEWHRRLRGYKDAPVEEVRQALAGQLAALVDSWMDAHGSGLRRLFGSGWDVVATVPSSRRPSGAPVDAVVARVPQLERLHRPLLQRGPEPTGHLVGSRGGFELIPSVERHWLHHRKVLVVDDTIVTGARAQTAAATLRLGGARVTGVVVIGRMVGAGAGGIESAPAAAASVPKQSSTRQRNLR